ncbi:MAG: TlpA family protein disulfide reductase [Promethearchaeota archaeon]
MARKTIKLPQKDSKEVNMTQSEKISDIVSSIDSIQGKQRNLNSVKTTSVSKTKVVMVFAFFSIIVLGLLSLSSYPQTLSNLTNNNGDSSDGNLDGISEELNFEIQLLDGRTVMLKDYAGKPIILDLMATWCVPCKTQIVELRTLAENFPNVQIISVSIDPSYDSMSRLSQYKEDNEITWVLGRDMTQAGKEAFSARSIPTVAFINSEGNLKGYNNGVVFYDTLVDWIKFG